MHHSQPYTEAMKAGQCQYGQPHELAQSEIATILNLPDIKAGDSKAFQSFSLSINLLVGMLTSLEGPQGTELTCTGHVDRLLSKLPKHSRDGFIEHLQVRGRLQTNHLNPYNLHDLSEWLSVKAAAQRLSAKMVQRYHTESQQSPRKEQQPITRPRVQSATVYHGGEQTDVQEGQPSLTTQAPKRNGRFKRLCIYCRSEEHYLSQCPAIQECPPEQIIQWVKEGKRCWKCGRTNHKYQECTLKKPCGECNEVHLRVLHSISSQGPTILHATSAQDKVYLTNSNPTGRVYLKIVPVLLRNGERLLETYGILDDGAERTILLSAAAKHLNLQGKREFIKK